MQRVIMANNQILLVTFLFLRKWVFSPKTSFGLSVQKPLRMHEHTIWRRLRVMYARYRHAYARLLCRLMTCSASTCLSVCLSVCLFIRQVLVASGFQADHHLQRSAWLGKLPNAPGPRGAALQQALLTCITNTASSGDMTGQGRETGQGQEAGQGPGPGQGWQLASRPVIAFAVALLEKGNVRAAELADALSGIS